jgi:glutaminyl-tRNA synthetase
VIKNDAGEIVELRCTCDLESLTGATAGRRVKGTIHWVSAAHARDAEVRLYDRLFTSDDPGSGGRDPIADLNPDSLQILTTCKVEPMLARCAIGTHIQFERSGYFVVDRDSTPDNPVFNRTVTLKDSWLRIAAKQ